jgi:hypothetical protein
MHPDNKDALKERVVQAAETALADHGYVSLVDLFTGMRLLSPVHVESWRKGRLDFLEPWIQGSPNKIETSLSLFQRWVSEKGLRPRETRYVRAGRGGTVACDSARAEIPKSSGYSTPTSFRRPSPGASWRNWKRS